MNNNNNKIGKFISTLRKEKGLTQTELGNILYVTDKAVSKWERGLSLPDITILKKLADTLEVDVSEILNGEKTKTKDIDIEKAIEDATKQIKEYQKDKQKKIIIIISIVTIILIYLIFRNIYLGYNIKSIEYSYLSTDTKNIEIGVPKLSFMMKNRDYSYSYKNLRSSIVVENELKKYLKTLTYSTCNDTIYYYNEEDNFSIIDYSVKNNFLYSTISYSIVDDDYCYTKQVKKYQKYITLRKMYTMNNQIDLSEEPKNKLNIILIDGGDNPEKYEFKIYLKITYSDNYGNHILLEESNGDYEIKNEKLIYYRKEIKEKHNDLKIPDVSVFTIKKKRLILDDNYLSKYANEIKLK